MTEQADTYVFQVVDVTDDEMYYTVGIWLTLDAAKAELEDCDDPDRLSDYPDHDEYIGIEIRRRKVGTCGEGVKVALFEWESTYDEKEDKYGWKRILDKG